MEQQPLPLGKHPNIRDSQNDLFFSVPHINANEPGINNHNISIRESGHPRYPRRYPRSPRSQRYTSPTSRRSPGRATEMVHNKKYHFIYTYDQGWDPYHDIKLDGTYVGHFERMARPREWMQENHENLPNFLIFKDIRVQSNPYVYNGPYKFRLENIVSIDREPNRGGKKMNKNKTKRPRGSSKRNKPIALNRSSRRYSFSGGAGAAAAAAAAAAAEIVAIDAVFNGAVGGANLTKVQVNAALKNYYTTHSALSHSAKSHMATLMNSLSHHLDHIAITPALLAADKARNQADRDVAFNKDVASRSCHQPNILFTPLDHRGTDPKVNPASPWKH